MKPIILNFILVGLIVLSANRSDAQNTTTNNFYESIKSGDLSTVLLADSIQTEKEEGGTYKVKRAETLGFIGNNF